MIRKLCLRVGASLALASATSVAQDARNVVAPLPSPTGSYAIGTAVAYLVDTSRHDVDLPHGRPITVQLWYPAARSSAPRAPYLFEKSLGEALLRQQYYQVDTAALLAWRASTTHSRLRAPVAAGRFPLILFSVGQGVIRANYTSIAEELASHGDIVALVESPLQGMMVRPDGREVSDTAGRFGDPAGHVLGATAWSGDMSWVLDKLAARAVPALSAVARAIDWTRIGATGHSSGGLVAAQTCESDRRVRV